MLATICGLAAIGLWALLALLTAASGSVPPFQLVAICFSVAAALGLIVLSRHKQGFGVLRQPVPVWLLGVGGLFGYHFFYFTALRNAPPVEAGLIAYLWPMLIIVFSALLPGERLRWFHLIGGAMGLFGAFLLMSEGGSLRFAGEHAIGYAAAIACALIWSTYSVASRRFADVPSVIVCGFCAVAAALALVAHLALEETVWPDTAIQWLALSGLALGPVGAAFYLWDTGVKHGAIQVLGAASYAAPVLSTLLLILAGFGTLTWTVTLATALVTAGALLAAKDLLTR